MTVAWAIRNVDARDGLRQMPAESVQCVVTSPPYWGLRDYGLQPTVWGGVADHAHEWGVEGTIRKTGGTAEKISRSFVTASQGQFCPCGAWFGCLGLEPTPEQYIVHMLEVFAEVWRVMRPDGTLWLNIGDSYAGSGGARSPAARHPNLRIGQSRLSRPSRPQNAETPDP